MQYIIIYILTVIGSIIGEVLVSFKLIKDTADAGYLLDNDKLGELTKKIKESTGNNNKLLKFIPIINLLCMLKMLIDYNNSRETIITQFSIMGVLKEMTEEEKKEYNKRPSALKALRIDLERDLKLNLNTTSTLELENGKIWYEKSEKDYNILKATGSAENLSRFTQVNLIENHIKKLKAEGLKVYGNADTFLKIIDECDNYNQLEQKIKSAKKLSKIKTLQESEIKTDINSNLKKINEYNDEFKEQINQESKTLVKKLDQHL